MLRAIKRAEKDLNVEIVEPVQAVNVIGLGKCAEYLVREPVQKRLDRRVSELAVGVAYAGEAGSALAVHERLTLRALPAQ